MSSPLENTAQEANDVKAEDCKTDFHPVIRLPQKKEVTGGVDLLRMDFCATSNKGYSKSWEGLFLQPLLEIFKKPLQMCQWLFFECAFSANSPGTEIVEATATEIGCPQPVSKNGHGDGVLNWFIRLKEALYVNGYWISVTCSHTESNSSYSVSTQFLGTCIQILKLPQKPDFKVSHPTRSTTFIMSPLWINGSGYFHLGPTLILAQRHLADMNNFTITTKAVLATEGKVQLRCGVSSPEALSDVTKVSWRCTVPRNPPGGQTNSWTSDLSLLSNVILLTDSLQLTERPKTFTRSSVNNSE